MILGSESYFVKILVADPESFRDSMTNAQGDFITKIQQHCHHYLIDKDCGVSHKIFVGRKAKK
jgi:flagellum-specific peptidoglycan hydrolase FlgJ